MQEFNAELGDDPFTVFIMPPVNPREEITDRNVTVTIVAEVHLFIVHEVVMQQKSNGPFFIDMMGKVQVDIRSSHVVCIGIEIQLFAIVWFLQLDIDLSGHVLKTIGHRPDALTDVDGFDPCSGNAVQSKGRCKTTRPWNPFHGHLRIDTSQAQHLDLFASGNRVRTHHIHRGIRREAFTQVATGSLKEFLRRNGLHTVWR